MSGQVELDALRHVVAAIESEDPIVMRNTARQMSAVTEMFAVGQLLHRALNYFEAKEHARKEFMRAFAFGRGVKRDE